MYLRSRGEKYLQTLQAAGALQLCQTKMSSYQQVPHDKLYLVVIKTFLNPIDKSQRYFDVAWHERLDQFFPD